MVSYQTPSLSWSTDPYAPAERYDAWDDKLNDVFGLWRSDARRGGDFRASFNYREADGFQVVECRCDPCGAERGRVDLRRDDRDILAVQLVLSGRERMTIGEDDVLLGQGDILIWDTTREMRFEVLEPLHKLSVMMPLARLKCWMPRAWHTVDRRLASGSVQAELLSSYIAAIRPGFMSGALTNAEGLTEATIGLLINALGEGARPVPPESLRDGQMARVRHFIGKHLDDPDLSPRMIADGCKISVRYLHWLFEPTGTTVLRYAIQQRLIRCRRELENPQMCTRSITDIAYASGFQNPTHFSRRFKAEYGLSPQDFRMEAVRSQAV